TIPSHVTQRYNACSIPPNDGIGACGVCVGARIPGAVNIRHDGGFPGFIRESQVALSGRSTDCDDGLCLSGAHKQDVRSAEARQGTACKQEDEFDAPRINPGILFVQGHVVSLSGPKDVPMLPRNGSTNRAEREPAESRANPPIGSTLEL